MFICVLFSNNFTGKLYTWARFELGSSVLWPIYLRNLHLTLRENFNLGKLVLKSRLLSWRCSRCRRSRWGWQLGLRLFRVAAYLLLSLAGFVKVIEKGRTIMRRRASGMTWNNEITWNGKFEVRNFFWNGAFPASFFMFYKLLTAYKRSIKVADDWIRTRVATALPTVPQPLLRARKSYLVVVKAWGFLGWILDDNGSLDEFAQFYYLCIIIIIKLYSIQKCFTY